MSGAALQHSVDARLVGGNHPCEARDDGAWRCSHRSGGLFADEIATYRVEVDGLGCWQARRIGLGGSGGNPERISGCVTLTNFILG